eukprot:SAG22_NODE_1117_length_5518_cov_6.763610_6_plen_78_part_00
MHTTLVLLPVPLPSSRPSKPAEHWHSVPSAFGRYPLSIGHENGMLSIAMVQSLSATPSSVHPDTGWAAAPQHVSPSQ